MTDARPPEPVIAYQDDAVTLYHGEALDVLSALDPVDHVITDPPYLLDFDKCISAGRRDSFAISRGRMRARPMGYAPFGVADVEAVAPHIARLARRWCLVFSDAESSSTWREAMVASGMSHVRVGAWIRTNATPQFTGDRPGTGFELCEIAHGTGERLRWNGGGGAACWPFAQRHGTNGGIENEHPTPKPVDLLVRLVRDFTDEGDTVLDPFAGSGTTGVACKRLGRKAILVERDVTFCTLIARRLEATEPDEPWQRGRHRPKQSKIDFGT